MGKARDEISAALIGEGPLGKAAVLDEPVFILRAQDCFASELVRQWASWAEATGVSPEKVAEARAIGEAMLAWPRKRMPD